MKLAGFLKNNTGSSSVLVILIMITLVSLGVLSMMSSFSGLKLAKKSAEWSKEYYRLESKSEAFLFKIDGYLINAQNKVKDYMALKQYLNANSNILNSNLQATIVHEWHLVENNSLQRENFLISLKSKLYFLICFQELDKISKAADFTIVCKYDIKNNEKLFNSSTIMPRTNVITLKYVLSDVSGLATRNFQAWIDLQYPEENNPSERYRIISWKELPRQFEYKTQTQFQSLEEDKK